MRNILLSSYIIVLIGIFSVIDCKAQQRDSIQVCFVGYGKGEKFNFYFDGKLELSVKIKGRFKYSFKIPNKNIWKEKDQLDNLIAFRKGRYNLFFRDTYLQVFYQENKKFLVIWKNPALKNRIAIDYEWTNQEPKPNPYTVTEEE